MYSALLIEDDEIVLQGLITQIMGMRLPNLDVRSASDKRTGWMLIEESPPHILLCDIRLRGEDGLAFCESVAHRHPGIRIILLSRHYEYEFAARAIRLGATDLLLKPVDLFDLYQALMKAIASVDKERSGRSNLRRLELIKLAKNTQARIDGSGSGPSKEKEWFQDHTEGSMKVEASALAYACLLIAFRLDSSIDMIDTISVCLIHMPEWEPGRNLLFYEIEPGCWGILVRFAGEASIRSETHERTAERLIASFDTALAEQESAGFGYCCAASGVHQTAGGALEEAQEVLRHRMLLEPRSVLRPADIAPCREWFKLLAGMEATLKMAVEASRYKAVSELLDELCEQLRSARYTYDSVRLAYTRLVLLAFDHFGESIPPRTLPKLLEPTRFQSVRDMFFQLKSLYLSVINAKFRDYAFERTSIRLVYEVKAYIDVHYAEHLSLEHIAMERNLHASYLSTLFKDVLGVGFQDYVLRVRVGNAKMLMNTGHYKIKQVAEMTGFSSPNYFSSMFRKATGQSPKQFMAEKLSVSPGIG